ncbi:MAG: hypothetical protein KAU38_00490 [Desulfobacterales bacterium]|nr:hypothetical protein [Desulfobacterales bacterium]
MALITSAILWPIRINTAPLTGLKIPAPLATLLASDAKLLFFGGIMFVVIFVVFSKKRAIRVFIVAFCTIGGIIGLDVKKGGLVC